MIMKPKNDAENPYKWSVANLMLLNLDKTAPVSYTHLLFPGYKTYLLLLSGAC